MKAITPAKLIPPDQSTAASGTLPTEQTKLRIAISGPTRTFSIVRTTGGASVTKRTLKKSLPSRPMKPASRNPIEISFQSIFQSERKLCATSVQAETESSRWRQLGPFAASPSAPCSCTWPSCASCAWRRACSSSRGETKRRSSAAISTIRITPPTYSASANCHPISTQSTRPSSQTKLVEANWKASAVVAEAPFWKSDLAIAIAA